MQDNLRLHFEVVYYQENVITKIVRESCWDVDEFVLQNYIDKSVELLKENSLPYMVGELKLQLVRPRKDDELEEQYFTVFSYNVIDFEN